MRKGEVKVFVGVGGNFALATPDTPYTFEALQQCDLTVQVSTKLNRSHLVHGKQALILPCIARSEKDEQRSGLQRVTVEDGMSMVHESVGMKDPASPTPALGAGDRRRHGARDPAGQRDAVAGLRRRLRPNPRHDEQSPRRVRGLQSTGQAATRVSDPPTGPGADLPHEVRPRRSSPLRRCRMWSRPTVV